MRRCALNINLTKTNLTNLFWELKEGLKEDQSEFFVSYGGREHRMLMSTFYKLKVDISICFGNRKINTIKNARGASSVEEEFKMRGKKQLFSIIESSSPIQLLKTFYCELYHTYCIKLHKTYLGSLTI